MGGNACSCAVSLRIPNLCKHSQFAALCKAFELRASWRAGGWDMTSSPSLGISQVTLVTGVIEGCSAMVGFEEKLGQGQAIDDDLKKLISKLQRNESFR